MKNILLFDNFNSNHKFHHLTSKDELPSLFKGIRTDLSGKWEQGSGFYVTTDLKNLEEIEGIGSREGEASNRSNLYFFYISLTNAFSFLS
jgi:hypothetical protein